ncbi:hypothetical protein K1719_028286 [Acacia pycnantha]|nr:hypothetical protein K1719_028286 [Acacia pycnantha]
MIEDHYLIVQRWRPNFNPWKADLQCHIAAWVRLPDVLFEFYNVESLRRISNMIGKIIKVDKSMSIYDKGGFARICVELDLQQPLLPSYKVFGEERPIVYKGLHQVCFMCWKNGFDGMQHEIQESLVFKSGHGPKYLHMFVGYCGKQDVFSCLKVDQLLQRRCFISVNIT